MDANKLEEQSAYYTMGVEVNPMDILSVRAGLNQQGELTAGMGINVWPLRFDYAYSSHEELGIFNKLSVTFRWGNVYEARIEPLGMNTDTDSILMKGLYNEVKFVTTVPHFDVKRWELKIIDGEGNSVRKLEGKTRPPDKILWDMMDDAGQPVKRGTYQYRFQVEYFNDKTWVRKGSVKLDYNSPDPGNVEIKIKGEQPVE